jgi:hypothetical protein
LKAFRLDAFDRLVKASDDGLRILAFDSRKLHRDVGDGAMLLVANDAHNGAVVELEFGVAREVCCSKRRDASGNQRVEEGSRVEYLQ